MTNKTINLAKLAALAQLKLDGPAQSAAMADLQAIVDMIDTFSDADVGDTQPMSHPLDLSATLRPDVATAQIDRDVLQALAPDADQGMYLVPQVIESD